MKESTNKTQKAVRYITAYAVTRKSPVYDPRGRVINHGLMLASIRAEGSPCIRQVEAELKERYKSVIRRGGDIYKFPEATALWVFREQSPGNHWEGEPDES